MQSVSSFNNSVQDLVVNPDQVLVAIPALNERHAIEPCIRSLVGTDPFMKNVQIVVADGGSIDGTLIVLEALESEFPNLSVVHNAAMLQSAGVNVVAQNFAKPAHEFLIRCDAHAIYPPGYVEQLAACMAHRPDIASVVVPMDSVGLNRFSQASAWVVETKLGSGGSAHRGRSESGWIDHGHHAGFRLSWFRKVGGYDATFSHNEDAEYDHRLGLAGGKIWLAADIRLRYLMRPSLAKLAKQYWTYGKGRARTVLKHKMRPRLRQMIPVLHVVLLVLTLILGLIWPTFWIYPMFYLTVLAMVSLLCALRLRRFGGLFAGPALAAMHVAWGAGFLRQCANGFGGNKADTR